MLSWLAVALAAFEGGAVRLGAHRPASGRCSMSNEQRKDERSTKQEGPEPAEIADTELEPVVGGMISQPVAVARPPVCVSSL